MELFLKGKPSDARSLDFTKNVLEEHRLLNCNSVYFSRVLQQSFIGSSGKKPQKTFMAPDFSLTLLIFALTKKKALDSYGSTFLKVRIVFILTLLESSSSVPLRFCG